MNNNSLNNLITPPTGMPALAPELIDHAEKITNSLLELLEKNNNWIAFSDYMRFCLYEPELGYYSSGLEKFGDNGDFTTAPEISPIFGECIAEAVAPLLKKNPDWSLCELGPGRGALAESVLIHLQKLDALPVSYQLLEVSASLSNLQKQRLDKLKIDTKITHLQQAPIDFKGIILGNEVLDALVVERFQIDNDGVLHQVGISLVDEKLVQITKPAPNHLRLAIETIEVELPKNYTSEICLQLNAWLENISENAEQAIFLFSDYGLSQQEYYSPERNDGTLRCHYRQYAHNNFCTLPGMQDLTAWVNFTQLAEAALSLNMDVISYTTQAHFILGSGRLQKLDLESFTDKERYKNSKAIQMLTLPANMGERFRFMQLNKNCDEIIPAMTFRDLRHQL